MEIWLAALVLFLAAFTQSLSGFGLALVSMALLPAIVGIQMATPLVALAAIVIEVVLLLRFRQTLELRLIWPVVLASVIGTPVGVLFLRGVDERIALSVLGVVIAGYALYALFGLRLPELKNQLWPWLAGFVGGALGGAYNTSGPPVIIYADCRKWPRETFKSNLQGYFIINSLTVLAAHFAGGTVTSRVWATFWPTLPAIALGLAAGLSLDHRLDPQAFRKIVLALLVVMGLRLVF
ncbi:MAG: sulfite exporter TauE/SafE family protein [Chloroflexota bacterium]